MSYKLTVVQKPGYIHATITGSNTPENVRDYLTAVERECIARGCFRILIEERLEGPRLGTLGVFGIVSEASKRSAGVFSAIAYVDVNAAGSLMKFAENVAINRGISVMVFQSVSEAERWLRDTASPSS
jgi:hypothetical protein